MYLQYTNNVLTFIDFRIPVNSHGRVVLHSVGVVMGFLNEPRILKNTETKVNRFD